MTSVSIHFMDISDRTADLERVFAAAARKNINGLITIRDAVTASRIRSIAELATKHRLPSMNEDSPYVELGGLMSYAANDADQFRRAAYYVDRILKGAKPADLPVEQPTKFELVINLKTAKQIGLTIPPRVLARADKVIK
jgi:putative tryptophan/tyrosine transport system substrate-binding protein